MNLSFMVVETDFLSSETIFFDPESFCCLGKLQLTESSKNQLLKKKFVSANTN